MLCVVLGAKGGRGEGEGRGVDGYFTLFIGFCLHAEVKLNFSCERVGTGLDWSVISGFGFGQLI